jgi:hypothetical protein
MSFDDPAKAWCMESCTPGMSVSAANKCHGRADQACSFVSQRSYVCLPSCTSDAECGSRKCEIATGFCTATVAAAPAIGTPCDPNATTDVCAPGYCQDISLPDSGPAMGVCTAPCRLGGLEGCGYSRNAIGPSSGVVAACLGNYKGMDGDGDQGFCWQLCDIASNCLYPAAACNQSLRTTWGHGVCEPTTPYVGDGGAVSPEGGTDGSADAARDGVSDAAEASAE